MWVEDGPELEKAINLSRQYEARIAKLEAEIDSLRRVNSIQAERVREQLSQLQQAKKLLEDLVECYGIDQYQDFVANLSGIVDEARAALKAMQTLDPHNTMSESDDST